MSWSLSALDDQELGDLLSRSGPWRASVHGNQTSVIDLHGTRTFVKQIALTDLERAAGLTPPTANLFGLPDFYHYGVGSAGFGAYRELGASLAASDWARSGACPYFPLVYHWRLLPRTPPTFSAEQQVWLDRAPDYWDGNEAIRARLSAIAAASASIVMFLEHVPQPLAGWLPERQAGDASDVEFEDRVLRIYDQWREAGVFLNTHGVLHFDLNASNILVDEEQIYVADFGMAISDAFDLSPMELAFIDIHRRYDAAYVEWAFREWLAPKGSAPALPAALLSLIERGRPVANVFGRFLNSVATKSKSTSYPRAELEAALGLMSQAGMSA